MKNPLFLGNTSLYHIVTSCDLSKPELRLLLLIMSICNRDGECLTTLEDLSKALSTAKQNAATALRGLVSRNIIKRLDEANRGRGAKPYRLKFNVDAESYVYGDTKPTEIPKTSEETQIDYLEKRLAEETAAAKKAKNREAIAKRQVDSLLAEREKEEAAKSKSQKSRFGFFK